MPSLVEMGSGMMTFIAETATIEATEAKVDAVWPVLAVKALSTFFSVNRLRQLWRL